MRYALSKDQDDELWTGDLWREYELSMNYSVSFREYLHERFNIDYSYKFHIDGSEESIVWLLLHL